MTQIDMLNGRGLKFNTADDFARLIDFNKLPGTIEFDQSNNLLAKKGIRYHINSFLQMPVDGAVFGRYIAFKHDDKWKILDGSFPAKWPNGKIIKLPEEAESVKIYSPEYIGYTVDDCLYLIDQYDRKNKLPSGVKSVCTCQSTGRIIYLIGDSLHSINDDGTHKFHGGTKIIDSIYDGENTGIKYIRQTHSLFAKDGTKIELPHSAYEVHLFPTQHIYYKKCKTFDPSGRVKCSMANVLMPNGIDYAIRDAHNIIYDAESGQVTYVKNDKLFRMSLIDPCRETLAFETAIANNQINKSKKNNQGSY